MDAPDSTSTTSKMAFLKAPPDPLGMDDPLDGTLTTKNIVLSLRDIWRWFQLGIFLEFKCSRLKRIQQDKESTEDRITEIVGEWLRVDPLASWKKLVDALKAMEEYQVAFNIITEYPELKRRHEEYQKEKLIKFDDLQSRLAELEQQRLDEEAEWERIDQQWSIKLEVVKRDYAGFQDNRENKLARLRREFASKEYKERAIMLFADSRVECEELLYMGERIDALVEWDRMLKDRERKIKLRQQKWKETAEELEAMQERLQQNEEELSTRLGALSQLAETHRELLLGERHGRFKELKESMQKCRERVARCKGKLQTYQEYLRSDEAIMSQCRIQLESSKGELENLKYRYEHCLRKVQDVQKELSNHKDSLLLRVARFAAAAFYESVVTGTEPATGAAVGSVLGYIGAAFGYIAGGAAGLIFGENAADKLLQNELETCEQELTVCIDSVDKGERLLETIREMNSEDD